MNFADLLIDLLQFFLNIRIGFTLCVQLLKLIVQILIFLHQVRITFSNELPFIVFLLALNIQGSPISGCFIILPNAGIGFDLKIIKLLLQGGFLRFQIKLLFGKGFFLNNPFVVAVVLASTTLPFTIYLLSGYLATLPKAYEEAAYVDGAGYFTTMVRIILPMAKPSVVTVILFEFLSYWNEYIISMTMLTDPNGPRTLPVGLLNLMKAQNAKAEYGQMYAGLVLVMVPVLILYMCVQKKLTQGMTLGGLKG